MTNQPELVHIGLALGLVAAGAAVAMLLRLVQRLERRVADLEALSGESPASPWQKARSDGIAVARSTDRGSRPEDPGVSSRQERASGPAPEPRFGSASANDPLESFNRLAANFSQANLSAFQQEWRPTPVKPISPGLLAPDPQGELWIIRDPDDPRRTGILVPADEVVRKWDMFYRPMGSAAGRNLLEPYYEVREDAPLRLKEAATVREEHGAFRVLAPGKFSAG